MARFSEERRSEIVDTINAALEIVDEVAQEGDGDFVRAVVADFALKQISEGGYEDELEDDGEDLAPEEEEEEQDGEAEEAEEEPEDEPEPAKRTRGRSTSSKSTSSDGRSRSSSRKSSGGSGTKSSRAKK
jgi:hypothetical protein